MFRKVIGLGHGDRGSGTPYRAQLTLNLLSNLSSSRGRVQVKWKHKTSGVSGESPYYSVSEALMVDFEEWSVDFPCTLSKMADSWVKFSVWQDSLDDTNDRFKKRVGVIHINLAQFTTTKSFLRTRVKHLLQECPMNSTIEIDVEMQNLSTDVPSNSETSKSTSEPVPDKHFTLQDRALPFARGRSPDDSEPRSEKFLIVDDIILSCLSTPRKD